MLKTLDILIGATTVLLIFSMAVTVITQAVTSILNKRGQHLLGGLASLLQQLGIPSRDVAEKIAHAVLTHPMVAGANGELGTVVQRAEFTKLLLDMASDQGAAGLEGNAKSALQDMLRQNGINDPALALKNIRAMALTLEGSNPELASSVRDELAILHEAASDYVAKIHSWFDQTIDRVSQAFTKHAHRVTLVTAFLIVLVAQLDIIAVVDRLSIDEQFRNTVATGAAQALNEAAAKEGKNSGSYNIDTRSYYNMLNSAGLITLPTNRQWLEQLSDPRKYPGMIIAILLVSLGAPFWYNILKDLVGLRSSLAQKDDQQRAQRQSSQSPPDGSPTPSDMPTSTPPSIKGERGDLAAAG